VSRSIAASTADHDCNGAVPQRKTTAMTRTYLVTLLDAVHYRTAIEADTPEAARIAARQLWDDDFLRFSPVDDGSVEIIAVTPQDEARIAAEGGGQ
jgi:hypothetical protein